MHNLSRYTFGYWFGRLFRMDERDCITMAIEVGMQNGGLASGLAKKMGKMVTVKPQAQITNRKLRLILLLPILFW